jgi:hypothetical protein
MHQRTVGYALALASVAGLSVPGQAGGIHTAADTRDGETVESPGISRQSQG